MNFCCQPLTWSGNSESGDFELKMRIVEFKVNVKAVITRTRNASMNTTAANCAASWIPMTLKFCLKSWRQALWAVVRQRKTKQLKKRAFIDEEKPSQVLRRLQCLSDTAVPEPLLPSLWIKYLPSALQLIIATIDGQPLHAATDSEQATPSTTSKKSERLQQKKHA